MKIKSIITLLVISVNCFGFAQNEMDSANIDQMDILKISVDKEGIFEFQGKELPEFKLVTINGDILNSNSLKGKPTLINFWFDSCAPCIEEMPILNEIRSNLIDVNFIAITFQDKNQVSKFLERKEFNFIHLIEARDYINKFGLFGYPKSLILDKNLVIVGIEKMIPKDFGSEQKNKSEFKQRLILKLIELKKP